MSETQYIIGPKRVVRVGNSAAVILGKGFKGWIGQYVMLRIKLIKLPPLEEGGG